MAYTLEDVVKPNTHTITMMMYNRHSHGLGTFYMLPFNNRMQIGNLEYDIFWEVCSLSVLL